MQRPVGLFAGDQLELASLETYEAKQVLLEVAPERAGWSARHPEVFVHVEGGDADQSTSLLATSPARNSFWLGAAAKTTLHQAVGLLPLRGSPGDGLRPRPVPPSRDLVDQDPEQSTVNRAIVGGSAKLIGWNLARAVGQARPRSVRPGAISFREHPSNLPESRVIATGCSVTRVATAERSPLRSRRRLGTANRRSLVDGRASELLAEPLALDQVAEHRLRQEDWVAPSPAHWSWSWHRDM